MLDLVRRSEERGWWTRQPGLPQLWRSLIDFEAKTARVHAETSVKSGSRGNRDRNRAFSRIRSAQPHEGRLPREPRPASGTGSSPSLGDLNEGRLPREPRLSSLSGSSRRIAPQ